MIRHQLGRLLGLSVALYLPLVACGADNDITGPTAQPPAPTNTNTQTDTNTQTGDELSDTDHLTSGDTNADTAPACVASACTVPPNSVACCTNADDVTAVRAAAAG